MRDAQELPDRVAHVGDFQGATRRPGGNIKSNQRADAGAIEVGYTGEIEHDSLRVRNELTNLGMKPVGDASDQSSTTTHDGDVAAAINGKNNRDCISGNWH